MNSFYVHIPFCLSKCHYCDFFSLGMGSGDIPEPSYLDALSVELTHWTQRLRPSALRQSSTVYFGGGTPSLFSPEAISTILKSIDTICPLMEEVEITLEVNPKTAGPEKLKGFHQAGVKRVSMGVQSLDDGLLNHLGRAHSAMEAEQTLQWILEEEFEGVNVDLMYGLPHQDCLILDQTLERLSRYPWKHLSAYELILEEHTPFFERYRYDRKPLPETEEILKMRNRIESFAEAQGMVRYEISNYSRPGLESRHNLHYWNYDSFVGLGAGAVSFLRREDLQKEAMDSWAPSSPEKYFGVRWTNPRHLKTYLESPAAPESAQVEWIDYETAQLEFIMMGLRKTAGIRYQDFFDQLGREFPAAFQAVVQRTQDRGWVRGNSQGFYLSPEGTLFCNEVIQEFMK